MFYPKKEVNFLSMFLYLKKLKNYRTYKTLCEITPQKNLDRSDDLSASQDTPKMKKN